MFSRNHNISLFYILRRGMFQISTIGWYIFLLEER